MLAVWSSASFFFAFFLHFFFVALFHFARFPIELEVTILWCYSSLLRMCR